VDRKLGRLILLLVGLFFTFSAIAKDVYVRGYTRKDGTYVAPHYRSSPNDTKSDNYSTRGNYNPYTGERGTRALYEESDSAAYWLDPPVLPSPFVPVSSEADRRTALRLEINALGERLKATDPYWAVREPIIVARLIPKMDYLLTLSTAGALAYAESAYWAIPAGKTGVPPAAVMAQLYTPENPACESVADARRVLADAARDAVRCAERGGYADDCRRETRQVKYAGEDLEAATSDAVDEC
jgi:hypothetical protein